MPRKQIGEIDTKLYNKILAAAKVPGMEKNHNILNSFATQVVQGYSLSEKQSDWLNNMFDQADQLRITGPYKPDNETVSRLRLCMKMARAYSDFWYKTHPGTAKAINNVSLWLTEPDVVIDEWCVNKVLRTFKTKLDFLAAPKAKTGDILKWTDNLAKPKRYVYGIIVHDLTINDSGKLVFKVLTDGLIVDRNYLGCGRKVKRLP
ncbi:hypothetical protein CL622_02025 [archaeon]|nr:hypothetical protein [archaeon]|tara:strand:- start:876 stop:1490 length:615 start_codon:yes stop_codon:yes gene_type:complete